MRATLRLHLAEGVGALTFRRLVDFFGDAVSAARASVTSLKRVEGVGEKTARAITAVSDDAVQRELDLVDKHGVTLLVWDDEAYPYALRHIADAPPVLYVRGRLEKADAVSLAIVGSRRCSYYGQEQARRFGALLGRAGFAVVSGGARGIDTAAHEGALEADGRTVVVMGCGLATVYPRENARLFERIIERQRGAVVSGLPMAIEPSGRNFPARNRIISGLSQGVLVVEAAYRSGSLITAELANEQGRPVFALPGRVDSPFSDGTHQLIRDGAILTRNLDDILEQLGGLGELLKAEPTSREAKPSATVVLDDAEQMIVDTFGGEPMSVDQIVELTGRPAQQVVSAMTMLAIKGVVEQQPGNVFALKATAER